MKWMILLLICGVSSCASDTPFSQNYNRDSHFKRLKSINARDVYVEEIDANQIGAKKNSLKAQGYVLVGTSFFTGEYSPSIQARNLAAQEGCERVLVVRRKVGRAVGTRMEAAAYTPPSIGFVNSDVYLPRGGTYTATTTIFNPGQSVYAPRDYVYDVYEHGAGFFTRSNKLESR